MKKIYFIILLLLLSGVVSNVYATSSTIASSADLAAITTTQSGVDHRVKALENVLNRYNSPLAPYAASYIAAADKNGTDWKLLPSIAGLESGFGKRLMPGSHNAYGWGSGHIYFTSWEEGMDKINAALKAKYYARGADTVWTIGPIYAESPTWAVRVNSFMEQMDTEYKKLQLADLKLTI